MKKIQLDLDAIFCSSPTIHIGSFISFNYILRITFYFNVTEPTPVCLSYDKRLCKNLVHLGEVI